VTLRLEARAAAALLTFCESHGYNPDGLVELSPCASALKWGRVDPALSAFARIPLGGMGTLGDWSPRPKYPHETDDYVIAVFDALLFRLSYLMGLLRQRQEEPQRE
jgi:hypothetical protein